jgi:hypothetical protein
VDLQCPDSKAVWPILLQLTKLYGPQKLQLVATLFPLPYHHNAFFAAQVTQLSPHQDLTHALSPHAHADYFVARYLSV